MYFSFPHVARLPARRLTDKHLTGITTNLGITHSEVNPFCNTRGISFHFREEIAWSELHVSTAAEGYIKPN